MNTQPLPPAQTEPDVDIQSQNPTTSSFSSFPGNKRKGSFNNKPFSKRPRFNQKPGQNRRGGAAYNKTAINPTTLIRPRRSVFPVFVSDEGCTEITRVIYSIVTCKDRHMGAQVPLILMQYVAHMVFYARLLYVGSTLGYYIDREANWLKNNCKSILLPEILAKYIETLGYVDTPNGHRIVPFIPDWERYKESIHSERILQLYTELQRPFIGDEHPDELNIPAWALDTIAIMRYNTNSSRALRLGPGFRTVNFENPEGRKELLVSTKAHPDGLIPCASFAITQPEAITGATHRWRRLEDRGDWLPAENHLLEPDFEDSVVMPDVVVYSETSDTYIGGSH